MKLDRSGNWCWPAHWRLSPNCGERPSGERISLIVLHGISLPPGEFGTGCPEALFLNRLVPQRHREFEDLSRLRVSAHVLIERDGTVTQFVPFRLCACTQAYPPTRGGKAAMISLLASNSKGRTVSLTRRNNIWCSRDWFAAFGAIIRRLDPTQSLGMNTWHQGARAIRVRLLTGNCCERC